MKCTPGIGTSSVTSRQNHSIPSAHALQFDTQYIYETWDYIQQKSHLGKHITTYYENLKSPNSLYPSRFSSAKHELSDISLNQ